MTAGFCTSAFTVLTNLTTCAHDVQVSQEGDSITIGDSPLDATPDLSQLHRSEGIFRRSSLQCDNDALDATYVRSLEDLARHLKGLGAGLKTRPDSGLKTGAYIDGNHRQT